MQSANERVIKSEAFAWVESNRSWLFSIGFPASQVSGFELVPVGLVFLPGQFAILVGVGFWMPGKIFILPCPALILVLTGSFGLKWRLWRNLTGLR